MQVAISEGLLLSTT